MPRIDPFHQEFVERFFEIQTIDTKYVDVRAAVLFNFISEIKHFVFGCSFFIIWFHTNQHLFQGSIGCMSKTRSSFATVSAVLSVTGGTRNDIFISRPRKIDLVGKMILRRSFGLTRFSVGCSSKNMTSEFYVKLRQT